MESVYLHVWFSDAGIETLDSQKAVIYQTICQLVPGFMVLSNCYV